MGATQEQEYDAHVTIAKRYFYAGFLGLPLLSFLMALNYRKMSKEEGAPAVLKTYVNVGFAWSISLFIALIAWIVYFQINWKTLESFQSLLVVNIPTPENTW
mmetsp:Transcript_14280/g.25586  ORF Transcript_14280/g.25586 Transcript_14280/m.25586 type:complete len:102 (-) Transcript_14280:133-438(-)